MFPEFNRPFWLMLVVGMGLRCVAINQPVIDAHLIRQCQTAAATENLISEPGFHLSLSVPWVGDLRERYVMEPPLYNYLVAGIYQIVGRLDPSGKIATILLWAVSFVVLQRIWRRLLDPEQLFWANLLFVFAPLSVFYGQAFMPEMLAQLLAFSFVLLVLRYNETPTLIRWVSCAGIGILALLIKLPEIAHLYLILGILLFQKEGVRAVWRPRYLISAALTFVALKGWSHFADSLNPHTLAWGRSVDTLMQFIGNWRIRFQLVPWTMIAFYLAAFVLPGLPTLVSAYGLWSFLRSRRPAFLGIWLISLAFFYLFWLGSTAANQSYYNLPALAPICALFGIGMERFVQFFPGLRWQRIVGFASAAVILAACLPVYRYLFKQDRQIFAAANWVRENTQPNDAILFQPNHSSAMIDYPYNPVMTYYGKRPTFVWTSSTPEKYRQAAEHRARYAIITLPKTEPAGLVGFINRFRKFNRQPVALDPPKGFQLLFRSEEFAAYGRAAD